MCMKFMHIFTACALIGAGGLLEAKESPAEQKEKKVKLSVDEAEKVGALLRYLLRAPREADIPFPEFEGLEGMLNSDDFNEELAEIFDILTIIEKQLKDNYKEIKSLKHKDDDIITILGDPETDVCVSIPEDTTPEQIEELTAGASLVSLVKTIICELHGF
jgi:hypothetical protein